MTMRTYRYFQCANGHQGVEKTSENDSPFSEGWEHVDLQGLIENGQDARQYPTYRCGQCGKSMQEIKKPPGAA